MKPKAALLAMLAAPLLQAHADTAACPVGDGSMQVEMVVFAYREGTTATQWPRPTSLDYPAGSVPLVGHGVTTPPANALVALPASAHTLTADVEKLKRGPVRNVLFHESWCQRLGSSPTSVAISGGQAQGEHQELEGSVSIWQDRMPQVDVNLWLTRLSSTAPLAPTEATPTMVDVAHWPDRPARPGYVAATEASPTDANQPPSIDRIVLHHQRSALRPGELRYLDHPLIGVLVALHTPEASAPDQPAPATAPAGTSGGQPLQAPGQ